MKNPSAPLLAEDLLLVLFQPDSGTIAGEHTLSYALAGAVLADLAFEARVTTAAGRAGSLSVEAVAAQPPSDDILRSAWTYVSDNPGGVQSVLAAIGPTLRQPLLERLIARGDIREENGKVLGLLKTATLKDGGSGRRQDLIADVRKVLVNGAEPTPRVAALAALTWGSGTLHQFDPELPSDSLVSSRARELQRGHWRATDTPDAVAHATAAMREIVAAIMRLRNDEPG